MQYMLLIHNPENAWTKDEWTQCTLKSSEICHELAKKGQFRAASPLHPVNAAKCVRVRVRDDKLLVTAGPFAETHEILGGFYVLALNSIDEAIPIAARHPGVRVGTVEIRQVYELNTLPAVS